MLSMGTKTATDSTTLATTCGCGCCGPELLEETGSVERPTVEQSAHASVDDCGCGCGPGCDCGCDCC